MKYANLNIVRCFLLITSLSLCNNIVGQFTQIKEPGIVVEQPDYRGYYALFGKYGEGQLALGKNFIETLEGPLTFMPGSAKLAIGPVAGTPAKLNLQALDDDNADLRLIGSHVMSSDGWFVFQLDDDNNSNAFFSVKGGDYNNDLFWIGENGNNYLNGDLTVKGRIRETAEKIAIINFLDFEVIGINGESVYGDRLVNGFTYTSLTHILGNPLGAAMAASIDIPDQSTITGVTIYYRDSDEDGYLGFNLVQANSSQNLFESSKTTGNGLGQNSGRIDVNVPVNYKDNRYRIDATSSNWTGQGVHHILIHYINYINE